MSLRKSTGSLNFYRKIFKLSNLLSQTFPFFSFSHFFAVIARNAVSRLFSSKCTHMCIYVNWYDVILMQSMSVELRFVVCCLLPVVGCFSFVFGAHNCDTRKSKCSQAQMQSYQLQLCARSTDMGNMCTLHRARTHTYAHETHWNEIP